MSHSPVRALVADDEEAPREQLLAALRSTWPALQIVATATNGIDAWDAFLEHEPALCFLDIRMPGLGGIDVARRIGGKAQVVFVTAYDEYALTAFDAGAVDYLLKPVDVGRLAQTVTRLRSRVPAPSPRWQSALDDLAARLRPPARKLDVLQAGVGREVRLIRTDDVIYFESDARYTRVVHAGGDALIRRPLKELLAQLDENLFWQVHRSVIVNHRHIASAVRSDEGQMHLRLHQRPETLPVSRHFQGRFRGD